MKKYFSVSHLPWTLIVVGLGLNIIELATTPTTNKANGGKLFGTTGWLKGVNDSLPKVQVPGTTTNVNLGGWLLFAGLLWLLVRKVT